MDTKQQTLAVILVLCTITIGATLVAVGNLPPADNTTTDATDTTTTDTTTETTTEEYPLDENGRPGIFLKDVDLIDWNIIIPDDWVFHMTEGENLTMGGLKGTFTIIDLMTRSCGWCEVQNDATKEILAHYGDQVQFISLTIGLADTIDLMAEYKAEHDLSWGHGIDVDQTAKDWLRARYTPTLIFIDADGILRYYHEGAFIYYQDMIELIDTLLPP